MSNKCGLLLFFYALFLLYATCPLLQKHEHVIIYVQGILFGCMRNIIQLYQGSCASYCDIVQLHFECNAMQ